ncbi:MAG: helix-turn-helix domain-containing protein [Candidatus Coproplasma sp.]
MFSFICKDIDFAHKLDKPSSPTEEYYKHIHPFNEILFLVRGNVDYTVESETRRLAEGDVVFIPSGKYHFATIDLSEAYERYVCKFPDSLVPDFIRKKMQKSSSFFSGNSALSVLFSQFDAYHNNYSEEEQYVMFISEIKKVMVTVCHDAQSVNRHDDFIEQLLRYIDANLTERISIASLAEEFHYSKSFINNEFKKNMRIPLMQYVRSKKIIAAHQMILSGMKKNEAAEMFGFETYSTFYRAYKKLTDNNLPDFLD